MHLTLNPLSAPHRTREIAGLRQDLTDTGALYPGTNHPLTYTIKDHDRSA